MEYEKKEMNETPAAEHLAEEFPSRWAYWLAAIGCSVGFGNIWRFPFMVYDYGGLAFFIPYLIMLALVVFPLTIYEFALGQSSQSGLIVAFNSLHDRCRGTGMGFMISFQVLSYYPLLLCWSLIYMINSCQKDLPWTVSDSVEATCSRYGTTACLADPNCSLAGSQCVPDFVYPARSFFIESCYIQLDHTEGVTEYSWQVLLGWIFTWVCSFLGLAFGTKVLGYMTYVTMTLPAFFLVLLVGIGSAQDGAIDGIQAYMGKFDVNSLTPDVWTAALAQGIFSMGALQGSMCGYAAHNRKDQNFVEDVLVVMAGDLLFAFLAGFAVFAIAGSLAFSNGVPLESLDLAGTSLVFQTYPVGLANIAYPGAQILTFFFFLTLFLLGFSTCVGCGEAIVMVLLDSQFVQSIGFMKNKLRLKVTGFVMTLLTLTGFLYSTNMGTHFLDTLDEFAAEITTLMFAYLNGLTVWILGNEQTKKKVGSTAFYTFAFGFHVMAWLTNLVNTVIYAIDNDKLWLAWAVQGGMLLVLAPIVFVVPLYLVDQSKAASHGITTMNQKAYTLYIENLEDVRHLLNDMACKGRKVFKVHVAWTVVMKFVIPIVASHVWLKGFTSGKLSLGEGPVTMLDGTVRVLPPYAPYIFVLCGIMPVAIVILGIVGIAYPRYMEFLLPPKEVRPMLRKELDSEKVSFSGPAGAASSGEARGDEEEA